MRQGLQLSLQANHKVSQSLNHLCVSYFLKAVISLRGRAVLLMAVFDSTLWAWSCIHNLCKPIWKDFNSLSLSHWANGSDLAIRMPLSRMNVHLNYTQPLHMFLFYRKSRGSLTVV